MLGRLIYLQIRFLKYLVLLKIVKVIEHLELEFVKLSNMVRLKHPKRECSIFFACSPSDQHTVRQILRRLKKDLLNCEPPIDVNKMLEI